MAASDFVISALRKIREGSVGNNRAISEAILTQMAGSINALIDQNYYDVVGEWRYYLGETTLGSLPPIRIQNRSNISYYEFTLLFSGSNEEISVDFRVYDSTGAFVADLFGTGANRVLVQGSGISNVALGRDVENATTFSTNTSGLSTFQFGNLSLTTLEAGYILVPFVRDGNGNARGARLTLRLKEE